MARPILTSLGQGQIHEALIFARFMDSSCVLGLSKIVHTPLYPTSYAAWQSGWPQWAGASTLPSIYVLPTDSNSIRGFVVLNDFH